MPNASADRNGPEKEKRSPRIAPAELVAQGGAEDGEDVIRRGAAAYTQLMKESLEKGSATSCWQQVSEQLMLLQHQTHEDACSSKGEAFRELIALTRMRCIYTRSGRPFPGPKDGCFLFPHEVPQDWIAPYGQTEEDEDGPRTRSHPCVQLDAVLQQLQQQQQQLQDEAWEEADGGREHSDSRFNRETGQTASHSAATPDANRAAIVHVALDAPAAQLQRLQQLKQQLHRRCIALTQRQAAACQEHGKMSFGTFALVREQINHIDNICFFLHSSERQRRTEEATMRLSAASEAATARMHEQLQHLEHLERLQQELQLQQLRGGNYLQQLLQQLQQGLEDSFAVLQQLKAFHRAVGEWMGEAEAFVVYGTAAFVAVLLTTSRRVAAARLGILGLICAAAAAEVVLHHEGISPYLLELTQRREPPRSTLEAAEKSSSMQGLLETLLRQAAESASAGLALHGTSLIRWACWVASSLLWIRCFRGYRSPEQRLQQQLQLMQQQMAKIREELREAQAAGDPRMPRVQQQLQQLLQCVAAKDTAVLLRLQKQQQEQLQHQPQVGEKLQRPQKGRNLARRVVGLAAASGVAAIHTICATAARAAVILCGLCLFPWSVCRLRRSAKDTPSPSPCIPTGGSVTSVHCTTNGLQTVSRTRPAAFLSSRCSSYCSGITRPQTLPRRLGLPLALREQSRRHNEDEGEAVDPTYQPLPSSSPSGSDTGEEEDSASAAAAAAAAPPSPTAGPDNTEKHNHTAPSQRHAPKLSQKKPRQQQQQQPHRETPSPQPLRRNPVRRCRVTNYAKLEEPQDPNVFFREMISVRSSTQADERWRMLLLFHSPGSNTRWSRASHSSVEVPAAAMRG
ncbi:uncharacterized protein LOC113146797 [Cyclospora cayetanensis]|uniref:Uncharacterized protein LOC113146797 n=1 Tax=Cyclospora cayetanensis TaxID=88456 RepID=A0A6P6RV27_9EIME|nr:uncharacterized protein LOC113146797 [Cyclospora cayetanensis]